MLSSIAGLILGFLSQLINDWLGEKRKEKMLQEKGALEAANKTDETTKEIADARSKIAAHPDDPDSVADRLQRKAAAGRGVGKS